MREILESAGKVDLSVFFCYNKNKPECPFCHRMNLYAEEMEEVMSLQFIIGNSGAGKSYLAYQKIIEESAKHPDTMYYVIVPEQFTMQTQKTLVEMHPAKGILNIDILSFQRLAYRIFEEVGTGSKKILEETGKSMVLQKMVQIHQKELPYLGKQMKKAGYISEVKSLISELMQYHIQEQELEELIGQAGDHKLLQMKLKDVCVLYQAFRDYLSEHYMTSEKVMDVLLSSLAFSDKLKNSVVLLDGFTGFTPIQNQIVKELCAICQKVYVTVTMDVREPLFVKEKLHQLFYMSHKMIRTLTDFTRDLEEPVLVTPGKHSRFAKRPALLFLEQHLFRYQKEVYEKKQEENQIFYAANPEHEMAEAARRILWLTREKGYRFGEIAIITGNLEEYGNAAGNILEDAKIPYFLDQPHTILMNPFAEYLRAVVDMAVQNFSYAGVFRYLRCGMSDLTRNETDMLENYVRALGIRGYRKWSEKWVRIYKGMNPESIQELNVLRERFIEEVQELLQVFSGGKKTVEEYCRGFYEFIVRGRIQEKLKCMEENFAAAGNKAMEKEYAQIYGIVMNLFEKMVEILGEEEVTLQEFQQLLETGMSEVQVALIPPSVDQVLIGDMERTRLKDVRALFFVGVNEGSIPKKKQSGGLLNDMDREFFEQQGVELAPGPKELMNIQRFYLYLNLTRPGERLYLSYSLVNGKGEATGPAYLIGNIRRMFPKLEETCAEEIQQTFDFLETPENSIPYFLNGLAQAGNGKTEPVFAELYSWYLRHPQYRLLAEKLVQAFYTRKPVDAISERVAGLLYGSASLQSATRLERFAACAFAHFLQYGLRLTERAEYEFRPADMGNVMHQVLERFAAEVRKRGLEWQNLSEEEGRELVDECLDAIAADYGNTILHSSARGQYLIERARKILYRTVQVLQTQLANGEFQPEGFELVTGGGRIDRLDVLEQEDKVYVKIIDYKTGNTSFDLVALYHGLQMQLMVYLQAAMDAEQKKHPDKEIEPAGILYYNVKDPLIQEKIEADLGEIQEKIVKELKMNGLLQADAELVKKIDRSLSTIPVSFNKDGSFSKRSSSVISKEQFRVLQTYVQRKIADIQKAILSGEAEIAPYELGQKNACTFCPYRSVCGFDKKLPGYAYRRLKKFSDQELWDVLMKGEK